MISIKYQLVGYQENGKRPFDDWLAHLDLTTRARISTRVSKFEDGHFGDYRHLSEGLFEARFFIGPGYRIYFAIVGRRLVLLLLGGDKSSQQRDIRKARTYLKRYLEEN